MNFNLMMTNPFRLPKFSQLLIILSLLILPLSLFAGEGMWMPNKLKKMEAVMQEMGLKISVDKIYNKDGTGLNSAVVLFGRGCTGEVISNKGLLLTNHHCGYGTVQGLSGPGKDYFANGFWAMNRQQELPCPGLTVTFVKELREVTPHITSGLTESMTEAHRDSVIDTRIKNLIKGFHETGTPEVAIKPFFQGNEYWAIISETFRDIRLVGFPPNGIGSFGGDTDNWMWPRHTGDFSVFRIYANASNQPADYSATNKPYQPKTFFKLNAGGIQEGDFSMVFGFPGSTQQYISSYQLNQIYSIIDPIRIQVRSSKLDVWKKHMNADRNVFLKYTSKKAGVANGWKKWQGEVRGLSINNVIDKKKDEEMEFARRAQNDSTYRNNFILETIQANAYLSNEALKANEFINESIFGIELINVAAAVNNQINNILAQKAENENTKAREKAIAGLKNFYKNYDRTTDQDLFGTLIQLYAKHNSQMLPAFAGQQLRKYNNDYENWAEQLYQNTILTNEEALYTALRSASVTALQNLKNDPALQLAESFNQLRRERITPVLGKYNDQMVRLNRRYMQAQLDLFPQQNFYPDANLTLRLTFGKIKGINPDGPAPYSYQTWLSEAVEKHNPDVEEFDMPDKLQKLYENKNFGKWKVGNDVPVCFLAQNHTTGGNSGSPVLNGNGELIGINFDRIWEGTMSDLYYDPNLCRNISVDIRYILFIIEKFGGAGWLLNEMNIVK